MLQTPRRFFHYVYLTLALLSLQGIGTAQYRADIEGTVTDTSGAVIPRATVSVTNQETGAAHETSSSAAGFYRVPALPPGRYTVSTSATGFKQKVMKDVAVAAEALQAVNITLEAGNVKQTITVAASVALSLQTENANLSSNLSSLQITRLPQVGRDPYELLRLTPGVFGDGARDGGGNSVGLPNTTGPGGSNTSIFQTENQVPVSSAGQRLSNNNYLLDEVSVNSLTWGGAAVLTPNQESVAEIRVVTNGYSAEYGRNSGATVEVVSKSGANQFHGSGFFKYDEPGLNAYTSYGGANALPTRVNNADRQFGGSLGGPIKKDKLFFFGSYEGLRQNKSNTATGWVETPQFRQSVTATRAGGVTAQIFQASGIASRIQNVLDVPCPSDFAAGTCRQVQNGLDIGSLKGSLGEYVDDFATSTGGGLDGVPDIQFVQFAEPERVSGNQYNGRVDFNASSKDTIAGNTYVSHLYDLSPDDPSGARPIGDVIKSPLNSATTLMWNRVISASLLSQARMNVTRYAFNQLQSNPDINWGMPRVEIQGFPFGRIYFGPPRDEATPGIFAENTIAFSETLNHMIGNKGLKYGVEIRKEQDNNNLLGGARPDFVFQGPWNLANDAPIFETINADPRTGLPVTAQRYFRTSDYGLFLQNDWKLRPNLTLNLGLRWEYFTPIEETRGQLSNLVFGSAGLTNARVEVQKSLYNPDRNNFAPRFGFAYSPAFFGEKVVVRGGFGVFYNRIPETLFANTRGNPPFLARYNNCCGVSASPNDNGLILYSLGTSKSPGSYPVNPKLALGIDPTTGGPNGTAVEVWGALPDTPNSYVHEWSFGFEYSLPANMVLALGYEGSAGHKLIRLVDQNYLYPPTVSPIPGNPTFQPFFRVFVPQPDVNSSFNAFDARLTHAFSHGLQAQLYYRFSKSIDESSYEGPGFVTNQTFPQDLKSERGPSDYDATHYLVASTVYNLPFLTHRTDFLGRVLGGWEIDTVWTAHSGFPWTPVSGQSVATPGGPTLSPTRPVRYFGNALSDTSNEAFIRPGGDFPGGGSLYFDISQSGPPGIGRNSFRGPHYFSADLSLAKDTMVPGFLHLGETARLNIRANFFNAFNKLNLAPFDFGSSSTHVDDDTFFGRATGVLAGRVIEFQARLSF
jgi:hypothetical protein